MSASVQCPECGEDQGDLWDHDWGSSEAITTSCGACDADFVLVRHVTVRYEAARGPQRIGVTMPILDQHGHRVASPAPDEQSCDHGITFDVEGARQAIRDASDARARQKAAHGAAVDFILGDVDAVKVIRTKWPRGWFTAEKPCPKGCGFIGIAYASYEHYIMGDW